MRKDPKKEPFLLREIVNSRRSGRDVRTEIISLFLAINSFSLFSLTLPGEASVVGIARRNEKLFNTSSLRAATLEEEREREKPDERKRRIF